MIWKGPALDVPDVSLTSFILERADQWGDKPALIDGLTGRQLSYRALTDGVKRVATALHRRGLRKGDVFAIFSPNILEYPIAFHAVASIGGVITTINSLYTPREIANQLHDSRARYLLTVPAFMDRVKEAINGLAIDEVFVFGEADGATAFADLMAIEPEPVSVEIDPKEDLVALPYSSGTTGVAKGVMLTHRNLVANVLQAEDRIHLHEGERVLGVMPFYHIYGMTVVMNLALHRGATVVSMARFELEPFLRVLQDHKVERAYVAPPIVVALAKHPLVDRFDLSSVSLVFSGAAPLDQNLAETCATRLSCKVNQGYGMTEASPATHLVSDQVDWKKVGSIGPVVPGTECKVVDVVTGEELGPGQDGEILVRGPQVMKGYLNNPTATAQILDKDGWLHTGDIGHADADGDFYVVDRVKELIKYKAYQVPPAELEAILLTHPAVADAAVIPSPDEEAGEVPKAFVVLKSPVEADALMQFVAERVAPYKKVRLVETIDEIPKSASGKILRRKLVERERAKAPARDMAPTKQAAP
ncbi:MAG TPA: 4-coumarate--CoA ligase family protein [Candidatus Acidoferrum sp.]|nr:4-coumarate--CoA ligase family protein [Candidatus Acidoferrum sp.]